MPRPNRWKASALVAIDNGRTSEAGMRVFRLVITTRRPLSSVSNRHSTSGSRPSQTTIWGISSAPCLTEIPHLVDLREQYKDRGFEIVGLTSDLLAPNGETDPDLEEEAKEIVTELDVTYPVLVLTGEIRKQMQIIATPTTVFVNDKGQVIGDVIMGTRSGDEWDRMIRDILDQQDQR